MTTEKLPFDYFNNSEVFVCRQFGPLPVADGFVANVRRAMVDIHNSHIALGYALMAYAESHTFGFNVSDNRMDCQLYSFFYRCEQQFNLDKSSVSRHVNVVYRFGDGKDGLRHVYRDKSFSYLCELLPLSEQEIEHCLSFCKTVNDIRKYKAELAELSKPKKSVATSQQKISYNFYDQICIPLSSSANEYVRYDRFRGMTVKSVLDLLLSAEAEIATLRSSTLENLDNDDDLSMFTAEEIFGNGPPVVKSLM